MKPLERMYRATFSCCALLAAALFGVCPAPAQTTTPITLVNIGGVTGLVSAGTTVALSGTGAVNPLGGATVNFTGSQNVLTGLTQGTFTFFFNRLDSFTVNAPAQRVGKSATIFACPITGGTGKYSGATGSVTCTFTYTAATPNSGTFSITGSGSILVGQTTTAITLVNFNGSAGLLNTASGTLVASQIGSVAPFGNAAVKFSGIKSQSSPGLIQGTLTFVFNANDSFNASFSFFFNRSASSLSLPCTIAGGTGIFRGAAGTLNTNLVLNPDGFSFSLTGSGSITQPAAGSPIIDSVKTAYGAPYIAQNTWLEIKGSNLAPGNTPAGGVFWNNAPEFAAGRLPTQVGGISVTVNGRPAYVWWFCSASTTPACDSDQINVLSPLDNTVGQVQVVVTRQAVSSAPYSVNMLGIAPTILGFDTIGHSVATHADYSYLGPASLFPGLSTPARPLEVVLVYAVGFGLPATPIVDGAVAQTGALAVLPTCRLGGVPATVTTAVLVSPGLYALVITVPSGATPGDNLVSCSYQNSTTPAGNLITVQ